MAFNYYKFCFFLGVLRLWNSDTGKCVYTTDPVHSKLEIKDELGSKRKAETDDSQNIVQMVQNKEKNNVTVVTYDQNISILSVEKLRLLKQVFFILCDCPLCCSPCVFLVHYIYFIFITNRYCSTEDGCYNKFAETE